MTPAELLRSPPSEATWTIADGRDANPLARAARYRLARALDAGEGSVLAEIETRLAKGDGPALHAVASVLAASDRPSDQLPLAELCAHLEHEDRAVAHAIGIAMYARASCGHLAGRALPFLVRGQRPKDTSAVCRFALEVTHARGLVEPCFQGAVSALLDTLDVSGVSLELLHDGMLRGAFEPDAGSLDGDLGVHVFSIREPGRMGVAFWAQAIRSGTVGTDALLAAVAKEARSKKAANAERAVEAIRNIIDAKLPLEPYVPLLDALLDHPLQGPRMQARKLLLELAGPREHDSFERVRTIAQELGAANVLGTLPKGKPQAAKALSIVDALELLSAVTKSRSDAARSEATRTLNTAVFHLARALRDPERRGEAAERLEPAIVSKTERVGVGAGRALAAAWLDIDEPAFVALLRTGKKWPVVGALQELSNHSLRRRQSGDGDWQLSEASVEAIAECHGAVGNEVRNAAWNAEFPGASALRDSILRQGAPPLVLVGEGLHRGRGLHAGRLTQQLRAHPKSLDVCIPQIAYAFHAQQRVEVLGSVRQAAIALLEGGEPDDLAMVRDALTRLLPLVHGALLDRDFAGVWVDRRALELLRTSYEAGVEDRELWPLLIGRLGELEGMRALFAARGCGAILLTEPLAQALSAELGFELTVGGHPRPMREALERSHLAASLLCDLEAG